MPLIKFALAALMLLIVTGCTGEVPAETTTPTPTVDDLAPADHYGLGAPGSFTVETAIVTHDSNVSIRIRNETVTSIKAFDVLICAFNIYGEPVTRGEALLRATGPRGTHCFVGTSTTGVGSQLSKTAEWRLRWPLTHTVTVHPIRSLSSDGQMWRTDEVAIVEALLGPDSIDD